MASNDQDYSTGSRKSPADPPSSAAVPQTDYCPNCNKVRLRPDVNYGINPDAVCICPQVLGTARIVDGGKLKPIPYVDDALAAAPLPETSSGARPRLTREDVESCCAASVEGPSLVVRYEVIADRLNALLDERAALAAPSHVESALGIREVLNAHYWRDGKGCSCGCWYGDYNSWMVHVTPLLFPTEAHVESGEPAK